MTPAYYYTWEFFTSIAIIVLVIAYIVHDQIKQRREKNADDAPKSDEDTSEKHHST